MKLFLATLLLATESAWLSLEERRALNAMPLDIEKRRTKRSNPLKAVLSGGLLSIATCLQGCGSSTTTPAPPEFPPEAACVEVTSVLGACQEGCALPWATAPEQSYSYVHRPGTPWNGVWDDHYFNNPAQANDRHNPAKVVFSPDGKVDAPSHAAGYAETQRQADVRIRDIGKITYTVHTGDNCGYDFNYMSDAPSMAVYAYEGCDTETGRSMWMPSIEIDAPEHIGARLGWVLQWAGDHSDRRATDTRGSPNLGGHCKENSGCTLNIEIGFELVPKGTHGCNPTDGFKDNCRLVTIRELQTGLTAHRVMKGFTNRPIKIVADVWEHDAPVLDGESCQLTVEDLKLWRWPLSQEEQKRKADACARQVEGHSCGEHWSHMMGSVSPGTPLPRIHPSVFDWFADRYPECHGCAEPTSNRQARDFLMATAAARTSGANDTDAASASHENAASSPGHTATNGDIAAAETTTRPIIV